MLVTVLALTTLNFILTTAQECEQNEACIPIRSCQPIIEQLKIAKTTSDSEKKKEIITYVRTKICGKHEDNLICCTDSQDTAPLQQQDEGELLGEFVNIFHDIGGKVYALSENEILIKGFTYDGEGPDAFFIAGETGRKPNSRTTAEDIVLPYPFEGRNYEYFDKDIPILGRFDGSEDIVLTLPPGVSTRNLRWISVWCRDYKVNFGHASF